MPEGLIERLRAARVPVGEDLDDAVRGVIVPAELNDRLKQIIADEVVDRKHAITRGLEAFRTDDELYSNLVGAEPIHVLLEAHSDTSGRREPIAWTRTYGEGRVFVSVLGHDVAARRNPAVQTLLRRGTRWAAGN